MYYNDFLEWQIAPVVQGESLTYGDMVTILDRMAEFVRLWEDVGWVPTFDIEFERDKASESAVATGWFKPNGKSRVANLTALR